MKTFLPSAFTRIDGVLYSLLIAGLVLSAPAQASVKAKNYQVGYWEGGAYLDNKTGALLNCVLTASDNNRNIVWLVRQTNGLYLGFMNPKLKLKANSKYKARIRIDALWAADITFKAQSKALALARIDTLPGATRALRRGKEMHVTFPSYKVIAPLTRVTEAISVLEQCRRTYGPVIDISAQNAIPDALAARTGTINVGNARPTSPVAPQQACDRLAGHPNDPGHVGNGISFKDIAPKRAIAACRKAVISHPKEARFRYQLARAYDKAKNAKASIRNYWAAIRMGYPQSFYTLGRAYENGWDVDKNEARALALYKVAFDAGVVAASVEIGNAFKFGLGGPVDMEMAAAWYAQGARRGYSDAEVSLALLYEAGNGVPKDPEKVIELVQSAALHENPTAMVMLGLIYLKGNGVKADKKKALDWLRLAYAYGHPAAEKLALGLAEKLGTGRDLPPIIEDILKSNDIIQNPFVADGDTELLEAMPPVVIQSVEIPPVAFQPIGYTFTGVPIGTPHWLTLATPEQSPEDFLDRALVDQYISDGAGVFNALPDGEYELRVIALNPKGSKSILSKTSIAVGAPKVLSNFILSLMDDLDQALPAGTIAPVLLDFSVDTAAAPTPDRVRDFAFAMAGEAQRYFNDALGKQDPAALGIAKVLAEAARSLAPDTVEITILAASTLTAIPDDFNAMLEAENLLSEALKKNPASDDLRLTLATIAFETGGAETALDTLAPMLNDTQALMGDPATLAALTKMFIDSERYDQGLILIRKLIPEGAKGEPLRFYEASLLGEAGRIDEARAVLASLSRSRDRQIAGAASALLKELKP